VNGRVAEKESTYSRFIYLAPTGSRGDLGLRFCFLGSRRSCPTEIPHVPIFIPIYSVSSTIYPPNIPSYMRKMGEAAFKLCRDHVNFPIK
jgi:hypothetical protein